MPTLCRMLDLHGVFVLAGSALKLLSNKDTDVWTLIQGYIIINERGGSIIMLDWKKLEGKREINRQYVHNTYHYTKLHSHYFMQTELAKNDRGIAMPS